MNALQMRMLSLWPALRPLIRIKKRFRTFARAESGAAAFYFALSSPVWLGGLALGAEVGSWYYFEQKLQATADAVAVSIAGRVGTGASQAELDSLANDFLTRNQFNSSLGSATVTLSSPPGPVFVNGNTVNVELTRTVKRYLSGIFQPGEFVIRVAAAAQVNQVAEGCVLASGVRVLGDGLTVMNAPKVQVIGCEALSNGDRLAILSSTLVTDCARSAAMINITGGILSVDCRNGPFREAGLTLDPYIDLPDLDLSMVPSCSTSGSVTIKNDSEWETKISPTTVNGRKYARFCSSSSLTVQGAVAGTTVTLPEWTFIFDGPDFNLSDRTHLNGMNVSFFFLNGSRPVMWAPNSVVTLTADASGMLFRGGRTNVPTNNRNNQFGFGPGSRLRGAIYFPASPILFQANGNLGDCPQIIGRTVTLSGTWRLDGPCRAPGIRPIVASRDVDLTQ